MFKVRKRYSTYQDTVKKVEFNKHEFLGDIDNYDVNKSVKTVTFQLTEDCNLKCTYCYQINKSPCKLSFDYAKKFIDLLIEDSYKENTYFSLNNTMGIIVEFIGGEPLLEVELMDQIVDYFRRRLIELNHPWIKYFRISMISNGVLYFKDSVQKFIQKNKNILSFSISLDGCKELHDSCRVFENGEGSYDLALSGCKHYMENYDENMFTKMTFAPENINYTYEAITNLIDLGYEVIHCNPVYEDVWGDNDHVVFYNELKRVADYLIDTELYKTIEISMFDNTLFNEVNIKDDNRNYFGSTGHMIALCPDGSIYPCVRFMRSSLGNKVEPYRIGDIFNGINITAPDRKRVNLLDSITLTSQSTDECVNCKIASGCGW